MKKISPHITKQQSIKQQIKPQNSINNSRTIKIQSHKVKKQIQIDDEQRQRFNISFSIINVTQQSKIQQNEISDNTSNNYFGENKQDIIQQNSFKLHTLLQQKISQTKDKKLITKLKESERKQKQNESCLQKWLHRLKKADIINSQGKKSPQLGCIITKKYQPSLDQIITKIQLQKLNLKDINIQDQYFQPQSLSLSLIDQNPSDVIYSCNFPFPEQNQKDKNLILSRKKQIKLKNLLICIPDQKNIQLKIILGNLKNLNDKRILSSIFIKERLLNQNTIPLFSQDQQIKGYLSYKSKTIQNACIQSLEELPNLQNQQKNEQDYFKTDNFNDQNNNVSEISFQSNTSFRIKNKKINGILSKKQSLRQSQMKKQNLNENQQEFSEDKYEDKIKSNVQMGNKIVNNDKDTFFQLKKSKTQFQRKLDKQGFNQGQKSLRVPNKQTYRKTQLFAKKNKQIMNSSNKSKDFYNTIQELKKQGQQLLESTQSKPDSPIKIVRNRRFTQIQQQQKEIPQKKSILTNLENIPFVEIKCLTVILYKQFQNEQNQSQKFVILSSQKGQMFITQSIFTNQMNFTWKNKKYQFKNNQITISLFEKIKNQHQISENILLGNAKIDFINKLKNNREDFYRGELYYNGKNIGTIIVIYKANLNKLPLINDIKKSSQKNYKNKSAKLFSPVIHNDPQYQKLQKIQEQKCQKHCKSPKRKRKNTIQEKKKKNLSPKLYQQSFRDNKINRNSTLRKNRTYQGGKNIKIGKAERFTNNITGLPSIQSIYYV